jgi:hypothetical protein
VREYTRSVPVEERGSSRQSHEKTHHKSTGRTMILIPYVFSWKKVLDELEDKRLELLFPCRSHCALSVDEKEKTTLHLTP